MGGSILARHNSATHSSRLSRVVPEIEPSSSTPRQENASVQVQERDEFLGDVGVANVVSLEFDAGIPRGSARVPGTQHGSFCAFRIHIFACGSQRRPLPSLEDVLDERPNTRRVYRPNMLPLNVGLA